MKKAYYLLFYKLYSFLKSINEEGWEVWRALAMFCLVQVLVISQIYIWVQILFKESAFDIPYAKFTLFILCLLLSILNHQAILRNDRWRQYAAEFQQYSKRKKYITSWLTFLFILVVLGGLIAAFWVMSTIDWSPYR